MKFSTILLSLILIAGIAGMVCAQGEVVVTLPAPGSEKGYFAFNSIPSGADVTLDGIYQGETFVVAEVSTTGNAQHTIQMNLGGYQPWSSSYTGNPKAGETIPITATLIPVAQAGSIHVTSNPSGATVILDDSRTAYTPYTYSNIPVGSHTITVHMAGYDQFYTSVSVQAGVTAEVSATLDQIVTIGSLSVSSSPSGASVYVDNIYRGVTTVVVGNLQAGTHTVLLVKAGYKNWQENVNVVAGTATYLNPKLEADPAPVYATVSVQSNPTGADVYGDGVYIGRTRADGPLVFTQVKPGVHTMLVTKSGYQDQSGSATVVAGQDYVYNVNLKPVPNPTTGSISVTSSPIGAQVYINNLFRGYSPLTVDGLTPGMYTVALQLNGYQDWQSSATVTAGQTAQISATLLPKSAPQTPAPTPTPGPSPMLLVITLAGAALLLRKYSK